MRVSKDYSCPGSWINLVIHVSSECLSQSFFISVFLTKVMILRKGVLNLLTAFLNSSVTSLSQRHSLVAFFAAGFPNFLNFFFCWTSAFEMGQIFFFLIFLIASTNVPTSLSLGSPANGGGVEFSPSKKSDTCELLSFCEPWFECFNCSAGLSVVVFSICFWFTDSFSARVPSSLTCIFKTLRSRCLRTVSSGFLLYASFQSLAVGISIWVHFLCEILGKNKNNFFCCIRFLEAAPQHPQAVRLAYRSENWRKES